MLAAPGFVALEVKQHARLTMLNALIKEGIAREP